MKKLKISYPRLSFRFLNLERVTSVQHRKRVRTNHKPLIAMALPFLLVGGFLAVPVPASGNIVSPSPVDTSNAIRWAPDNSPIGEIVGEFTGFDSATKKIDSPFPLNFFGARKSALCLSIDGVVYPLENTSSDCTVTFDKGLEVISLESRASALAALALDINLRPEKIINPQRLTTEQLRIQSVNVSGGTITVTTQGEHGFLVGEFARQNMETAAMGFTLPSNTITAVPTPTTYQIANSDSITNGDYTPGAGTRAFVHREMNFMVITAMSISGTTLTITTQPDQRTFGLGGKFTLVRTGVPGLDGGRFIVASRVSATEFTATVPAGITDLDPSQAGAQTSVSSWPSGQPRMIERDDVGAIQQVYFGTTTVEGRSAFSVTWYRIATNDLSEGSVPPVNPRTTSISVQLLVIKKSTGSDSGGWDFDVEINVGHATDASDGYRVDSPRSPCSVNSFSDLNLCRWGMGTARYIAGPTITSSSAGSGLITINTQGPHGFSVGQSLRISGYPTRGINNEVFTVGSVVDDNTLVLLDQDLFAGTYTDNQAPDGARLNYSEVYELFPNYSVLELQDAGGATSLVRNSLNSNVLGRYTFPSIGGQIFSFVAPSMGSGVTFGPAPAGQAASPASPQVAVIQVNPTNITVDNEIITILGANLNTVTEVYIGGVKVPIFTQSGNRLQVRAPKGLSGLVDLELKSSLNDVLMTRKLNFGGTAAAGTKRATLVVGGFDHNSRKLTKRMKNRIDRWLTRNSDLGTLTCTGFTSLPRRTTDVALSTNRGKTACNFSKRQRADLETSVSQGIEDPRPGSNIRRVRLVLTP